MLALSFTPFPVLETERLILRQITFADRQEIFTMRNDADITRYTGGPKAHTMDDVTAFIAMITQNVNNNEAILWGIALKGAQKIAGTICFWNIDKENDKAELGYVLMPAYGRKGIMQEALQAVIAYGFETMRLKTVEACTHENNNRSKRLLERSNFRFHEDMETIKAAEEDLCHDLIYVLRANSL